MSIGHRRTTFGMTFVLGVLAALSVEGIDAATQFKSVRFDNERIAEVVEFALKKSEAFQDLVATLEQQDRVIHVEEGPCGHGQVHSCLQPMATPGGKHLLIHLSPRQPLHVAAAMLAHELYHAAEIGRYPEAVDPASVRALFQRIGRPACTFASDDCWETRAAVAFERLVISELSASARPARPARPPR